MRVYKKIESGADEYDHYLKLSRQLDEYLLKEFNTILDVYAKKYDNTRNFSRRRRRQKKIDSMFRCDTCGSTFFVQDDLGAHCVSCGRIKVFFVQDDSIYRSSHSLRNLDVKNGFNGVRPVYKYNKEATFYKAIQRLMGIGTPFYFPHRYILRFKNEMRKRKDEFDYDPTLFIQNLLIKYNIYQDAHKLIPNIYYALTRKYYMNFTKKDIDLIRYVYHNILIINSRYYPDQKIPGNLFMLKRILKFLNIDYDEKKLPRIKEIDREWDLDKRWQLYLIHLRSFNITDQD